MQSEDAKNLRSELENKFDSIVAPNSAETQNVNDEMTLFLQLMAEKYKTPLHSVYTAIELIINNESSKLSDTSGANLRRAQSALQRMSLLTDDIIDYATVCTTDAHLAVTDLNQLIRTVLQSMRNILSDNLIILHSDRLPVIQCDPNLASVLFAQLFNNSVKYKKKVSSPQINITYGRHIFNIGSEEQKEYHIISVKDNCIGFPGEEAEMVLKAFYKSDAKSHKGSGLGLAVCKKIMEKHGGFIQAFSKLDEGTVIQLCFPVN